MRPKVDFLFFLLCHMTARLDTQYVSLQFSPPPSPSPSLDYSLISPPSPSPDRHPTLYASHPPRSQPYLFSTRYSRSSSRARDNPTHPTSSYPSAGGHLALPPR